MLAEGMALCTDVNLDDDGNLVGEPTEMALVAYSMSLGMNKNELLKSAPRVGEAPFDSNRKMMSTIHKTADGILQFTKGAPDEILKHCTRIFKNGEVSLLRTQTEMPCSKRIRNLPTEHFEFSPAATSSFHVFPRISRPIISKMSSSSVAL